MNYFDRVRIINTNSIWDDKEGVVEDINGDIITVMVDFIPEENKKVRQDFNIVNLEKNLIDLKRKNNYNIIKETTYGKSN